jgi:hypothetical protein
MLFKLITAEPDMSVITIDSQADNQLCHLHAGNVAIVNASLMYKLEIGPFAKCDITSKNLIKNVAAMDLSFINIVALTPDGKTAFKFVGLDRKAYPNISVSGFIELLKDEQTITIH